MGISKYANPKPNQSISIADALFTSTQQKVLSILFGQPGRSFYASELIALAGAGSGAVQRELKRLAKSGILVTRTIGNQKHYQANADSPIYGEVFQIVRKTFGLTKPLSDALLSIADKIDLAFVYGSVAKKTDHSKSDVDLLIVSNTLKLEELFSILLPVENEIRREINPTLLSWEEFNQRRTTTESFLNRVLQGEIIELIGNVNEH